MAYENIRFVCEDGIARLTLYRPERMNSFNDAMHAEVREALDRVSADASLRVLLLTGAGRGFCAGQDLGDRTVAPGSEPVDLGASIERNYRPLVLALRRLPLPDAEPIVLSDTVGFIRALPHDLVAAFRATLKEATDADLVLHVVDASHVNRDEQIAAVDAVLAEIGAAELPRILLLNKCDAAGLAPGVERDEYGKICAVRLSALSGVGVPDLHAALAERFPRPAGEVRYRAATA